MLMIEVIRLRHDILFDYIPKFDKCGRSYAHGRPVLSVLHCWVEGMDKLSFLPWFIRWSIWLHTRNAFSSAFPSFLWSVR